MKNLAPSKVKKAHKAVELILEDKEKKKKLVAGKFDKAYMIDIDGVVCEHIPNEFPEKMKTAEEIVGAKEWINSKHEEGAYICFFTARLEAHRKVTESWLHDHGFRYDQILFGKPRGGNYHYIDNARVQATTFKGRFTPMVSITHGIEVFSEEEEQQIENNSP